MGFSSVADSYEMIIIGRLIVGFHCGNCSCTFYIFSKKKHDHITSLTKELLYSNSKSSTIEFPYHRFFKNDTRPKIGDGNWKCAL